MTSEAGSQNRFTNGRLFLSNDIFCGCTGIKKPDRYVFRTCPVLVLYISDPNLQPDGCTVLPMSVSSSSYSVGFSDSATRFTRRVLLLVDVMLCFSLFRPALSGCGTLENFHLLRIPARIADFASIVPDALGQLLAVAPTEAYFIGCPCGKVERGIRKFDFLYYLFI